MTGGTAACVIVSRLVATDTNLRILLLLEAGPPTYNNPLHTIPVNFMRNLTPGWRTIRVHVSQPSAALGGRTTAALCGQCLGGWSSINSASCATSMI